VILEIARTVEREQPQAWVINYINPTAVMGAALRRFLPRVKSFALCDGLHMPHIKRHYAIRAGIIRKDTEYGPQTAEDFDLRIAGPNHFTWAIRAAYRGQDVMPTIAESLQSQAAREADGGDVGAKAIYNGAAGFSLYQIFGHVPTCVAHTKEYVRFWQGRGVNPEPIPPLKLWETDERQKRHDRMWEQVDGFLGGRLPIASYMDTFGPDHATDIIENMVGRLGKPFYVNTYSQDAVPNMDPCSFLELLCDFEPSGPRPRPVGPIPRGLRAMMEQVLDTHELTAEAIVNADRTLLRRAMLTDPLLSSIADADAILKDLIATEREVLPAWLVRS
jgi:alpha-galactosidase